MQRAIATVVCALLASCGRWGFDPEPDARFPDVADARDRVTLGATRDTYVSFAVPGESDLNFGAERRIRIAKARHGLVHFDVAALGPHTIVIEASLVLYVEQPAQGIAIDVHPLLESWEEGAGSHQVTGVANYAKRKPGVAWSTPGALPPLSAGAPIASFIAPVTGFIEIVLPASAIQHWVEDSRANHGLVLSTSGPALEVASRDHAVAEHRPALAVTYRSE